MSRQSLEVGKVYFCGTHQRDVEIIHFSGDLVACRAIDDSELFWGDEFSEAYTPEQISEENVRREAIDEIERIIRVVGPAKGAERLYDDGYRKHQKE